MFRKKTGLRRRGLQQKNIIAYVTKQYMKQNKRRTVTAYFGIVFMVLLLTCVFVGKDACIRYLEDLGSLKKGKWHACVYDITKEEEENIKSISYLQKTAASADFGAVLFPASVQEKSPYLRVKAYEPDCFDWMKIQLCEGRLPQSEHEIVISERAGKEGARFAVGEQIHGAFITRSITGINKKMGKVSFPYYQISVAYGETVEIPLDCPVVTEDKDIRENAEPTGKEMDYTIVGIIRQPDFEDTEGPSYTALTLLTETSKAGLSNYNLSMQFDLDRVPDGWQRDIQDRLIYSVQEEPQIEINDYVMIFTGHSTKSALNIIILFMMAFFTGLIVLASVFLIYNVFQMSYEERSRYLGMLASVGATGRQKRSSVYYEVYHLLLYALPVGILLGIVTIKLGITALSPFLGKVMGLELYVKDLPVRVAVSIPMLGAAALAAVLTAGISAYRPAARLTKIGPIASIRGEEHRGRRGFHTRFGWVRVLGIEGMLAKNVLHRQRKKTRTVIVSTAVFVVILVVTGFGAGQIQSVVHAVAGDDANIEFVYQGWDYVFAPVQCSSRELEDYEQEIINDPGVEQASVWSSGMFVGETPSGTMSEEYWAAYEDILSQYLDETQDMKQYRQSTAVNVLAVDDQTLGEIARITGADEAALQDTKDPAAIIVQYGFLSTSDIGMQGMRAADYRAFEISRMTDLAEGSVLPMEVYHRKNGSVSYPVTIAGFASAEQLKDYVKFHGEFFWIIMSWDNARKMQKAMGDGVGYESMTPRIMIRMNGKDTSLPQRLEQLCGENEMYVFHTCGDTASFGDAVISVVNIMLGCFVSLTSVICMLNLANSINGRFIGRRQDFAVLDSMGMTYGQKRRMLLFECVGIVIRALILAVVCSVPLMYIIRRVLVSMFGYYFLHMPWGIFILAAVTAVAAVFLITLYCIKKERTVDILKNIRKESV